MTPEEQLQALIPNDEEYGYIFDRYYGFLPPFQRNLLRGKMLMAEPPKQAPFNCHFLVLVLVSWEDHSHPEILRGLNGHELSKVVRQFERMQRKGQLGVKARDGVTRLRLNPLFANPILGFENLQRALHREAVSA